MEKGARDVGKAHLGAGFGGKRHYRQEIFETIERGKNKKKRSYPYCSKGRTGTTPSPTATTAVDFWTLVRKEKVFSRFGGSRR